MLDADLTSVRALPVDAVRGCTVRIRIGAPVDNVTYGRVTAQLDRTGHGGAASSARRVTPFGWAEAGGPGIMVDLRAPHRSQGGGFHGSTES